MKLNIWWKITIGIIILVLSIIGLFWFGIVYSLRCGQQRGGNEDLRHVITSNIRLPDGYSAYRLSRSLINKNEWFDLEPISAEEWKEVKCEFNGRSDHSDFHFNYRYANQSDLSEDEKRKKYCISPDIDITNYKTLPTNSKDYLYPAALFTGEFYAPCLEINFHEYILQYPKILNNILKITERPCDYLKNMQGENCYRNGLSCDSFGSWPYRNERTCVVINIISSAGELRSQMIVPRKDNNHLFNKK